MGLARTLAVTLTGLAGHIVEVEAHAAQGLPGFTLVGLPDAAVRESRERVRAALSTCGVTWGEQRLTVNLSPADLRKTGTGFDVALALGYDSPSAFATMFRKHFGLTPSQFFEMRAQPA